MSKIQLQFSPRRTKLDKITFSMRIKGAPPQGDYEKYPPGLLCSCWLEATCPLIRSLVFMRGIKGTLRKAKVAPRKWIQTIFLRNYSNLFTYLLTLSKKNNIHAFSHSTFSLSSCSTESHSIKFHTAFQGLHFRPYNQ